VRPGPASGPGPYLAAAAAGNGSGLLTVTRGKLRRIFCVEKGWLVLALSNLVEEQPLEYVARAGLLSHAAIRQLTEDAKRANRRPMGLLAEHEAIPRDALRPVVEAMVRDLLTSTLEWPDGTASWSGGTPDLSDEVTVRLSPIPLLLAHARAYPSSPDALRVRLGPPDTRLVSTGNARGLFTSIRLDASVEQVLERLDQGIHTIGELLQLVPADSDAVLRAAYGLILVGAIRPGDADGKGVGPEEAREPELTREECLQRLNPPAHADHYQVLGLDSRAGGDAIRSAYYALARRYHPDRLRATPLADLLPAAEVFFARVTEAYNTLSKADLRKEYDVLRMQSKRTEEAARSDTGFLARQNFLRGRTLAREKKVQEALTFLENAVRMDDGQADYHLELGQLLARNPRRREDAERHLLRATTLAPASVPAYLALGSLYRRSGRKEHAGRQYREALRWDPENAEALEALAEL